MKPGWSLDFLPITLLWAWALTLLPMIPALLPSGSVTHNPFLVWSLAPLPLISSKLKICHLCFPCRPGNRITHNARRPSLTTEVGAQVSRAPFHLWRRNQPLRDGWPCSLTSSPAWGRHLLQPHDWVQAAPPLEGLGKAGGWGLGCLSVCLSLLTIEPNHCFQD